MDLALRPSLEDFAHQLALVLVVRTAVRIQRALRLRGDLGSQVAQLEAHAASRASKAADSRLSGPTVGFGIWPCANLASQEYETRASSASRGHSPRWR